MLPLMRDHHFPPEAMWVYSHSGTLYVRMSILLLLFTTQRCN